MAIQMTRAEYEAKYGVKPSVTSAPIEMTRAEFNTKFRTGASEKPLNLNFFQRVGEEFKEIGEEVVESVETGAETFQRGIEEGGFRGQVEATGGLLRAGLRTAGGVARGAFAPILEAPGIKQATEFIAGRLTKIPGAEKVITKATELAEQFPEQAKDAQNIIDIVALGVAPKGLRAVSKETKAIGKDISQATKVALTPSEEAVQKNIINLFQKSIKPTAKKTLTQGAKFEDDTIKALKTIKANADELNIEDSLGEIVTGRTPQTINELAQSLDQTKRIVFNQYDDLTRRAGTQGATIDAKIVAKELESVLNNKALQLTNPEVIKYAEQWIKRLQGFDVVDARTTQEVVKLMNKNLESFYRNPTYESASKAAVDAGIANNFRKALDKAIEGATGEQYQILKSQYAALKAIEKDVVRASMRDARKNVKGLLDYTDIFTGGQMVGGILSLNPAMFTKGAIERGFKEWFKHLNDPNRAIGNIFEKLDIDTSLKFEPISIPGRLLSPSTPVNVE